MQRGFLFCVSPVGALLPLAPAFLQQLPSAPHPHRSLQGHITAEDLESFARRNGLPSSYASHFVSAVLATHNGGHEAGAKSGSGRQQQQPGSSGGDPELTFALFKKFVRSREEALRRAFDLFDQGTGGTRAATRGCRRVQQALAAPPAEHTGHGLWPTPAYACLVARCAKPLRRYPSFTRFKPSLFNPVPTHIITPDPNRRCVPTQMATGASLWTTLTPRCPAWPCAARTRAASTAAPASWRGSCCSRPPPGRRLGQGQGTGQAGPSSSTHRCRRGSSRRRSSTSRRQWTGGEGGCYRDQRVVLAAIYAAVVRTWMLVQRGVCQHIAPYWRTGSRDVARLCPDP